MLGNSDDTHEHYAGPTIKLIDFGSAADRQTPHGAMRENLSAVARVGQPSPTPALSLTKYYLSY